MELDFTPHFLNIVKSPGPPQVFNLWLGVSKGMLRVKYFRANKASFCVNRISRRSYGCHRVEVNLATISFGEITGFEAVVAVSTFGSIKFDLSKLCGH